MKLILFADRLPPLIGGMETHAHYFVKYFCDKYDLIIISKKDGFDCLVDCNYQFIDYINLTEYLLRIKNEKSIIFYNSGRWIEQMENIHRCLPNSLTFYRTGGNEIIKSPLSSNISSYEKRKEIWREIINKCVDYLVTNSDFTDKRLIEFGIKKDILVHIAGGIDIENIEYAHKHRNETRKKYGISENDFLISSCARFVAYKQPLFLIDSLSKCKKDFIAIFAGDGPLLDESIDYSKKVMLNAKFLNSISQFEALNLIAASDLYVQASTDLIVKVCGGEYIHTEGMGRSLLEAISLGIPVVSCRCGALSEYINDENGILVDSSEQMISAIDYFISQKKEIKLNSNYMNKYSFEKIFKEYEKIWKERGF